MDPDFSSENNLECRTFNRALICNIARKFYKWKQLQPTFSYLYLFSKRFMYFVLDFQVFASRCLIWHCVQRVCPNRDIFGEL